jgi:hypothetical protein
MAALNKEVVATVLIDAVYTTDEQACQNYGVSVRSLQRWRRRLFDGDPELAGLVATKKAARDAAWADSLPNVLAKCLHALEDCFAAVQSDPEVLKRPDIIFALSGAYKICAEVHLTSRFIEARVSGNMGQPGLSRYTN